MNLPNIIVTVSIFVIVHLIATVWWASEVNTTLKFVKNELKDLVVELKAMKDLYVKKEDFISLKEKHETMWKKIDFLQEKLK